MFFSKNKYNFMLNRHYKEDDEKKFLQKEKLLENWKEKIRQERFNIYFWNEDYLLIYRIYFHLT